MAVRNQVCATLTIPSGSDTSNEVIVADYAWARLYMPAALTGTEVSYESQPKEGEAYFAAPAADVTTFVASGYDKVPDVPMGGYSLRIVSDDTEDADREFQIVLNT